MKKLKVSFLSLIAGICYSTASLAMPPSVGELQKALPQARNVSCVTCHYTFGGQTVNPFGEDWMNIFVRNNYSQKSFKKLMGLDSDADGIINYTELLQGSNPGLPQKH